MKYRREVPFAALGAATQAHGWSSPQARRALRDVRRVLARRVKSRRRVNGRLVRLEVRP